MFDFSDPATVARLVGLAVPLLVGLVTKEVASRGLKATLNAALSAIGGSLAYLVAANGGYDLGGFFNSFLNAFVVSIATYYGVWQPTGIAQTVAAKTARFGVGSPPVLETDEAEDPQMEQLVGPAQVEHDRSRDIEELQSRVDNAERAITQLFETKSDKRIRSPRP